MSIRYNLTRSRRKTLSLRVAGDLTVDVRAPLRTPQYMIDEFVLGHENWIRAQLAKAARELEEKQAFQYRDGDSFLFRGQPVEIGSTSGRVCRLEGDRLLLPVQGDRPKVLADFLREETRRVVQLRVNHYARRMEVRPTGVKITSATTRWGSCSGRDSLCFTYRLACLPEELVDYVVVHELAHIRQHNHSPRFWAVVRDILPDCDARRRLLREYQHKIVV